MLRGDSSECVPFYSPLGSYAAELPHPHPSPRPPPRPRVGRGEGEGAASAEADRRPTVIERLQRGMTLVEVMVVVVIISLVASVVSVAVLNRLEEARKKLAFTQIKQVSEALELYKLSLRHYPSTGEGLQAPGSAHGTRSPS